MGSSRIDANAVSNIATGIREGVPGSPWRRRLGTAGAALAGLTAGILGISAYAAYRLCRPRRRYGEGEPPEGAFERVSFNSADGLQLAGWFLSGSDMGIGVVLCHGFHTGRREMLPLALALRERGHSVLMFDFRGHGESEGKWSSCGPLETRDLEGAVRYLLSRPEVQGGQVGVVGFSMGGAVAILTAERVREIGAVIADSSFATFREVVSTGFNSFYRLPAFPFAPLALRFSEILLRVKADDIRPLDAIASLSPRPILLIHGTGDRLVPLSEAYLLYESAGEPRELWTVAGADHVGARLVDFERYLDRVDHFIKRHLVTQGSIPVGKA